MNMNEYEYEWYEYETSFVVMFVRFLIFLIINKFYKMYMISGATVGHRELNRYYKQRLRPTQDVAIRSNVAKHYKALGWNGSESKFSC